MFHACVIPPGSDSSTLVGPEQDVRSHAPQRARLVTPSGARSSGIFNGGATVERHVKVGRARDKMALASRQECPLHPGPWLPSPPRTSSLLARSRMPGGGAVSGFLTRTRGRPAVPPRMHLSLFPILGFGRKSYLAMIAVTGSSLLFNVTMI